MIIEEAAVCKYAFVQQVIYPLLSREGTCCIGITTPDKEDTNWVKEACAKKHNGRFIFKAISHQQSCDDCIANDRALFCRHKEVNRGDERAEDRVEMVAKLMGDQKTAEEELLGRSSSRRMMAFDPQCMVSLIHRRRIVFQQDAVPVVFVVVDPAEKGFESLWTIMSFVLSPTTITIIAADYVKREEAHDEAYMAMLRAHVSKVRGDPRYRKALIIYFFEANLSKNNAARMAREVLNCRNLEPHWAYNLDQATEGGAGCWTTNATKCAGIQTLAFRVRDAGIFWAHDLMTMHEKGEDHIRSIVHVQMERLRLVVRPNEDIHREAAEKRTWTSDGPDDAVMCMAIAIYWSQLLLQKPEFEKIMHQSGHAVRQFITFSPQLYSTDALVGK